MLSRFITRSSSHLNRLASSTLTISPKNHFPISQTKYLIPRTSHFSFYSTNGKNDNFFNDNDSANSTTDLWKMSSSEVDQDIDSIFSVDSENLDANQVDDKMSDPFGRKDSSFSSNGVLENGVTWKNVDDRMSDPFGEGIRKDSSFSGYDTSRGVSWRNVDDRMSDPFGEGIRKDSSFSGYDTSRGVSWKNVEPLKAEEEYQPWSFTEETKEISEVELFGIKEERVEIDDGPLSGVEGLVGGEKSEKELQLEAQEKELMAVVKGPNRAFGDLIAASGITDDMLDSLIALKEFEGIKGLPSLSEIEDLRYERTTKKSSRAEIERQKQEAAAKGRVREVDEKGRAYGTGKRKCSIARVWINPGEGKFIINDKEFDVYFPMIDHRAALLRPFSETKTLGLWDVNCTVKGGGTSGQVGAIRLGISRALQSWEPDFRPPLKEAGFLTRDSRIVERKKPGKAKARKSFQWVKR